MRGAWSLDGEKVRSRENNLHKTEMILLCAFIDSGCSIRCSCWALTYFSQSIYGVVLWPAFFYCILYILITYFVFLLSPCCFLKASKGEVREKSLDNGGGLSLREERVTYMLMQRTCKAHPSSQIYSLAHILYAVADISAPCTLASSFPART